MCAVSAAAAAQDVTQPPQAMTVTIGLAGGAATGPAVITDPATAPGVHADSDTRLDYAKRDGRFTLGANAQSLLRSASSRARLTPLRERGAVDVAFTGTRTRMRASQSLGYVPSYDFGMERGGDFWNSNLSALEAATAAEVSRAFGARQTGSLFYTRRHTLFSDEALNTTTESAGVRLSRRITRDVGVRAGYGHTRATGARSLESHDLDIGIDYSRALSFSRRTTVTFRTGSAIVPQNGRSVFVAAGGGLLTHQLGRTWNARAGLNRGVQMLEGFDRPLVSNALTLDLGGALTRRTRLLVAARMSAGTVGVGDGVAGGYANWSASAGWSRVLGRRADLDAHYSFYGHRYDRGVRLPPGVPGHLQRHVLRVGVTLRAPIIGHLKGPS